MHSGMAKWKTLTLDDVVSIGSGAAPPKNSGNIIIMGANGPIGFAERSNFANGYLIGRVGAAGAVQEAFEACWASDNTLTVTLRPGRADHRFIGQLIRFLDPSRLVTQTAQPLVTQTSLGRLSFACPPVAEQRRIAEILDTLDDQIRATELLLAKLRTARDGLADDLLTAGVDEDGSIRNGQSNRNSLRETALGPRPDQWVVAPLREFLGRSDYGISSSLSEAGRVPVLRMNNLADGEARLDELKYSDGPDAARLLLEPGDVLFNRTNSLEHVGRTGIWRGQLEVASFASYLVRLSPNAKITNEYLNHLLNLRRTQIDLRRWATPGVHQVNVNPTNLRRVAVAVPDSLREQDRICDVLAVHDEMIKREKLVLSKLVSQKSGLLSDLLSGRVRVPQEVLA
jgi:type I restriction enzyme, S subunit